MPSGLAGQLLGYGQGDLLAGGTFGTGPTGLRGIGSIGAIGNLPYSSASMPAPINVPGNFTFPGSGGATAMDMGADVATGAGRATGAGGASFGSRVIGSLGGGLRSEMSAASLARAAPLGKAKFLGKGLGYGILGSVASAGIDKLDIGGNNSNWEQGLQGAALGAGAGAVLGPWGAAAGGAIGGAAGVLSNMFGGGDDAKPMDPLSAINAAVNEAGISLEGRAQITEMYSTYMALAERFPEGSDQRAAAEAQALEGAAQMVLQVMQTEQQAPADVSNTLALQAQAAQIFEPLAQNTAETGRLYAEAMASLRPSLPESYWGIADANVARELTSSQKLADAYRAQAAVTPIVDKLTRYQQDNDSYAAQMFSQQYAQQAAGSMGGAGGGADLQALLQG